MVICRADLLVVTCSHSSGVKLSTQHTGNIFGAGGIELLRGSLEAKGHIDALGTLSDDEGSEDEDGEKEEEEEDESTTANETNQSEDIEEDSTAETTRLVSLHKAPSPDMSLFPP